MLLKSCWRQTSTFPLSPRYLPQIPDICKGIWIRSQQWNCDILEDSWSDTWIQLATMYGISAENRDVKPYDTQLETVHYLVICEVHTHLSMVTHNHPDTRSHWLGCRATRYQVLIYHIISRPHVQARQLQMRSKEQEPRINKKEEKQNFCHFISTLKCIKQKL